MQLDRWKKRRDAIVRDMGINPWSDTILNGYLVAAEKFVRDRRNVIEIIAREWATASQRCGPFIYLEAFSGWRMLSKYARSLSNGQSDARSVF